jgi:hypothetical protein
MAHDEQELHCREQALALLDHFATRILPGTVRRIAAWKKIPLGELPDLQLELRQELAVDCLQHTSTLLAMPTAVRHARWMRLCERWVYRNRVVVSRHRGPGEPDEAAAPPEPEPDTPSDPEVVRLVNGRCNLAASAHRTGQKVRDVRTRLEGLAADLGDDAESIDFWRQRVGEALTGLAADLLQDRGVVHLLRAARTLPDPQRRLARLRRLGTRFRVRPSTRDARLALAPWIRRPQLGPSAPRRLLEVATALCPRQAPAWLWLFEACVADGDLAAATQALREGRQMAGLPRHAAVLARGRLLQVRGRSRAAFALLRRALRRWPRQSRLRHALVVLGLPGG